MTSLLPVTVELVDGTRYRARAVRVADDLDGVAVFRLVVGALADVAMVHVAELPPRSRLVVRGMDG